MLSQNFDCAAVVDPRADEHISQMLRCVRNTLALLVICNMSWGGGSDCSAMEQSSGL